MFWACIIIVIVFINLVSSIGSSETTPSVSESPVQTQVSTEVPQATPTPVAKPSVFDGDCGIAAEAELYSSIIGYPELEISIKNTSDKDIAAIQFYFIPCDVYGDVISGWTSQNYLYTDNYISAGSSDSLTYSFIESSIKTAKLYVYSVYFADGTEWGNKDATKSTILEEGLLIEVSGVA